MYVENGKISSRQIFRLYVFDLMGIATLLIPPYLADLCGVDGVFAILLGTVVGFVYLFYLGWIMKHMQTDMCTYLRENTNGFVRGISLWWVMKHCLFTAGACAYIFANLMQYSLIRESAFLVVLSVIVFVAAYAVSGGIESRARVYEVLFWFVLIPYIGMMLASVKNFEVSYVSDIFTTDVGSLLSGAYLVFIFLTPLFFSLFLIGEKEKQYGKHMIKIVAASIFVSALILLGSYILLIGNFGANALSEMKYPVVTLMSTIQFNGNFLKRMDALMLAVWFFTLYALLNLHLHYGVKMLTELTRKKDQDSSKTRWQVIVSAISVFLSACVMESFPWCRESFMKYYSYVAVPVMVVGPALLLVLRRRNGTKNEME